MPIPSALNVRTALYGSLLLLFPLTLHATDFVTHTWPMTGDTFIALDVDSVRFDGLRTFAEWLRISNDLNPDLESDLNIQAVMRIEVRINEDENPQKSLERFVLKARERAAGAGANLVFADDTVKEI